MRRKESVLKMNVMMTVEFPGGIPGLKPGQSLQLGKPLCDRKGGGTECPPSGGYRLDSGAAFVLAPPVHVCVSVQIGVCVCEQGDP